MSADHPVFADLEDDWLRLRAAAHAAAEDLGHIGGWFTPRASQDTAAATATVRTTTTTGEHMSLAADLHALAARLEPLGEEAVTKLEAVSANPATAEVFAVLHGLTGVNVDPTLISLLGVGLKELLARAQPQQAAA